MYTSKNITIINSSTITTSMTCVCLVYTMFAILSPLYWNKPFTNVAQPNILSGKAWGKLLFTLLPNSAGPDIRGSWQGLCHAKLYPRSAICGSVMSGLAKLLLTYS